MDYTEKNPRVITPYLNKKVPFTSKEKAMLY